MTEKQGHRKFVVEVEVVGEHLIQAENKVRDALRNVTHFIRGTREVGRRKA